MSVRVVSLSGSLEQYPHFAENIFPYCKRRIHSSAPPLRLSHMLGNSVFPYPVRWCFGYCIMLNPVRTPQCRASGTGPSCPSAAGGFPAR